MPPKGPVTQSAETPLPNRMRTRSANATTHPAAHLASKKRVKGAPTQAAIRQEKKAAKEAKSLAAMDRISEIEGRNAANEQTNVTPHASVAKRTYTDVVSGSGSEGEEEPLNPDAPSSCEPSQLDALRSETATAKSDSVTESDSEAPEPTKGSVTEDSSGTLSDTPPPPPRVPRKKKSGGSTKKTTKIVLSDEDFDFGSPPPSPAAVQQTFHKSKPAPKGPSSLEPPKKKHKSQVSKGDTSDSNQTAVPARKKAAASRGMLELAPQENPTQVPTATLKLKSNSKPGFRAKMKEHVQVKIEPREDEHMVVDELTPRKAAPERPRPRPVGKSTVPKLMINSDEVIEITSDTDDGQHRAAVKKGKQREKTKASSSDFKPRAVPSDAQLTAPYSDKPRNVTAMVADWGVKVNRQGTGSRSRSRSRSHGRSTPSLTSGSGSSHPTRPPSSTRSALHNMNVRIYQAGNIDEALVSELEDEGILSEKDETQGVERNAAVNSPYKGKGRATNARLVKVTESKVKLSTKVSNSILPPEAQENHLWRKVIVPTVFRWLGSQPHPFAVDGENLANIVSVIWETYLSDIPLSFAVGSKGHQLLTQRISDGWRNPIGSAAIAVVTAMLEDQFPDSDEERQQCARDLLHGKRFIYYKAVDDNRKKWRGVFQGTLIVQTLAAHECAIKGSRWLSGMFVGTRAPKPHTALAVSTTAVNGLLTIANVGAARESGKKLPPLADVITPSNPNEEPRKSYFGELGWGSYCNAYLRSITDNVSDPAMETIVTQAKVFARTAGLQDESTRGSFDPLDDRANLAEGSDESDDED
ncbi:hypothetical protein FIBSPDRAFT_945623 [Athelia psychrophila]|uniref:DUF6532 domain-containing protein n=1 Tax=Athelia psychrophila TaxID=1759441 RepID=A0A166TJR7_9AGAM|nr:hypothetical protein FIBSPDRAFT_945623 [Fibularhizoctonia sp. CBS 109695]